MPRVTSLISGLTEEPIPDASEVVPLDHSLLKLSPDEQVFLHDVVSNDEEQLFENIFSAQEESYKVLPYPCIRFFHFVNLMMRKNSVYPKVLEAGKTGGTTFLEIGCQMGSDVRRLVYDGYPGSRVLACDLRREFIDIGMTKLYQDKATCPIHFFAADVVVAPEPNTPTPTPITPLHEVTDLKQLQNRVTHLYAGALFHMFSETTQYAIAFHMAKLVNRERGAVIFGRHQGLAEEAIIRDNVAGYHGTRYGHSPESWKRMWKNVFTEIEGAESAERVVVDVELTSNLLNEWKDFKMIFWSVSII